MQVQFTRTFAISRWFCTRWLGEHAAAGGRVNAPAWLRKGYLGRSWRESPPCVAGVLAQAGKADSCDITSLAVADCVLAAGRHGGAGRKA